MATCPNGHQLKSGAVFCTACGADAHVACANGHRCAPDVRYCETCGATVGQATAFPVTAPVTSGDPSTRAEGTPLVTEVPPAPVPGHPEDTAGASTTAQLDTPETSDLPRPRTTHRRRTRRGDGQGGIDRPVRSPGWSGPLRCRSPMPVPSPIPGPGWSVRTIRIV